MLIALPFIAAMFVFNVGGLVLFGRGRSGQSITGPQDRPVDYHNPYGPGTYFFTNRRDR